MNKQPIRRESDGSYTIDTPVVFSCGCGGLSGEINSLLSAAGVGHVPIVLTSSNMNARNFIKDSGLSAVEPSLRKSRHAVLYNHKTTKFINLLKAKKDKRILSNIYVVANGR